MQLSENSKLFLLNNISKILYAYEQGAGSLIGAQCSDLVSAITHNVEDSLVLSGEGDWGYEIARTIRDCDEEGLTKILRSISQSEIGRINSEIKQQRARENGKLGGRPKLKK